MESKGFQNLSASECQPVAEQILLNADSKWQTAKAIAETKDYGTAVSIAIVSLEEQLKAMLLLADSRGFQFRRVEGMNAFFGNHAVRYITAYYIFVMAVFGEDMFRMLFRMRDNAAETKVLIDDYLQDKQIVYNKLGRYMMRKVVQLHNEMEWFSKIDMFRQEGLYSDYKGSLKTPLIVTEQTYIETMERLIRVRFAANEIIKALQAPEAEFAAELEKLQAELMKDEIYPKISEGIGIVGRNRKDPFSFIRAWFEDMRSTEV